MKGIFSWQKITAMMVAAVMSITLIQTPLLADTTDESDLSEEQDDDVSEDEAIYISSIAITDLDAPAYDCYPDDEITIVAKTEDGNVVDAVEKYYMVWSFDQRIKETGEECGGGMIYDAENGKPLYKFTEEFFQDPTIDEELTFSVYVQVGIKFKEGYKAVSDDSFLFTINGEPIEKYVTLSGLDVDVSTAFLRFDEVEKILDKSTSEQTTDETGDTDTSEIPYEVVEGADGTWDGESDYVVRVKGTIDDEHCIDRFVKVTVGDHEAVVDEECTVTKGSTIVTFKSAFLKTLGEGTHTITVYFTDSKITTTLTIKAPASTSLSGAEVPSTGETQSPVMYIGIAMIFIAGALFTINYATKRRKEVE